jgi:hypothetical protein
MPSLTLEILHGVPLHPRRHCGESSHKLAHRPSTSRAIQISIIYMSPKIGHLFSVHLAPLPQYHLPATVGAACLGRRRRFGFNQFSIQGQCFFHSLQGSASVVRRTIKMRCTLSNYEHYAKITNTLFNIKRDLGLVCQGFILQCVR